MTGLIHLYTGEGKGKTTASVGLVMRASGRGKQVVFAQFLKGRDTGEIHSLALIPTVTVLRLSRDYGFFRSMSEEDRTVVRSEHDAMIARISLAMAAGRCDLLVLDEIAAAMRHGLVDTASVLTLLDDRPAETEIIMTGRDAPEKLIRRADYITEMTKRRHPFDKGVPARKGIEW